jgi:ATP-dependent Clp protease ATP-binding subunit ClpB
MDAIVDIQMARLSSTLKERDITIELDDSARTYLADKGFDPIYGARPLKRVIQKDLQNDLANQILAGKVTDGNSINVSAKDEQLVLSTT